MRAYLDAVRTDELAVRRGRVTGLAGLGIEARGPDAIPGEICLVRSASGEDIPAEVVGLSLGKVVLMPYRDTHGIGIGAPVTATGERASVPVGRQLLGRVIDAFGASIDGAPLPSTTTWQALAAAPINPLARPRICELLETGIRAIDTLAPLGRGQRIGVFAGSGVGKSTLMGMLAREVKADINVIALIGERGREVREFIENSLGAEGRQRSVVVVATSDQPALARTRAALAATSIAEYFRGQGSHVLLMMDSLTRFAMARREIGLAAGEPPTARGYTPSVFAEIPALCERCGTAESGGSITALYTVLVEGDDFNEPISDIVRATLDGHIMLSRQLAHEGHFPAIDVLQSVSRLAGDLVLPAEKELMRDTVELLATYERNREMVEMGAYRTGSNPVIDRAIECFPQVRSALVQSVNESSTRRDALARLGAALGRAA